MVYPSDLSPSNSPMPVIKILNSYIFYVHFGLNSQKAYEPDGIPQIVLKNYGSVLTPCLAQYFHLHLITSTFPSFWKYAHV